MGAHPLRAARCARQRSFEVRTHSAGLSSCERRSFGEAPPKNPWVPSRGGGGGPSPRKPGEHNSIHGCLLPTRVRIFCRRDAHPGYRIAVREIGPVPFVGARTPPPRRCVFIYSPRQREERRRRRRGGTGGRRGLSLRSFYTLELLKRREKERRRRDPSSNCRDNTHSRRSISKNNDVPQTLLPRWLCKDE